MNGLDDYKNELAAFTLFYNCTRTIERHCIHATACDVTSKTLRKMKMESNLPAWKSAYLLPFTELSFDPTLTCHVDRFLKAR